MVAEGGVASIFCKEHTNSFPPVNAAEIKQRKAMYLLTFSSSLLKFILCLKASSDLDSGSGCSCCRTGGHCQLWATNLFSAGVTALQRGEPSTACTCSQATSSNRLTHWQTCQYQALIQLPIPCSRSTGSSLTASAANTRLSRFFPENHPQITASYLLTTPICSCASPSGQHDHSCHPTAS